MSHRSPYKYFMRNQKWGGGLLLGKNNGAAEYDQNPL
jgi:hypothetical protein